MYIPVLALFAKIHDLMKVNFIYTAKNLLTNLLTYNIHKSVKRIVENATALNREIRVDRKL